MLNGILIGIIIGLYLGWRLRGWWVRSSIKKATDVVGSATKKPTQVAKGLFNTLKGLWPRNRNKERE